MIVLEPHATGFGDMLLNSILPEDYAREGHTVKISTKTLSRNSETADLVWGHNPFVSGYTDEPANAGMHDKILPFFKLVKKATLGLPDRGPIEMVEEMHGFRPLHRFPKIYYQPKFIPEFHNRVIAATRSFSQPISGPVFDSFARFVATYFDFDWQRIIRVDSSHDGPLGDGALSGNPSIKSRDIFHLCDMIYSCKHFLVAESGGQVLASAIRQGNPFPEITSIFTNRASNDEVFTFKNVRYYRTGRMGEDFTYEH